MRGEGIFFRSRGGWVSFAFFRCLSMETPKKVIYQNSVGVGFAPSYFQLIFMIRIPKQSSYLISTYANRDGNSFLAPGYKYIFALFSEYVK